MVRQQEGNCCLGIILCDIMFTDTKLVLPNEARYVITSR